MAEEGLKITIQADAADAVKGFQQAAAAAEDMNKKVASAAGGFADAGKAADDIRGKVVDASKSFKEAGESANKAHGDIVKGSQSARYAVIDLGHIMRDLPYAISNPAVLAGPFDRMTQSLIQAKNESGSFKGALSAMASSLSGGAGILIGIEVVTSAIALLASNMSSAEDQGQGLVDSIKAIGDAADEADKHVAAFKSDLEFQNQYQGLGSKIQNFGSIGDGNVHSIELQINRQKDLIDQLNLLKDQLEPKKAEAMAAQIGAAYGSAEEKAAQESLNKISQKQNEFIDQIGDANKRIGILDEQASLARLENQKELDKKLEEERKKALAKLKAQLEEERRLLEEHLKLMKSIMVRNIDERVLPQFDIPDVKKDDKIDKYLQYQLSQRIASARQNIVPDQDIEASNKKAVEGLDKLIGRFQDAKDAAKLFESTLTPAFESLFEAIRKGEPPLKAFFESIGQSVEKLIAKLVAAAAEAAVLSLATGGVSGGGLSFGSVFKQLIGFGSGSGGVRSYGGLAGVGSLASGGRMQVEVRGILSGRDMLLMNARNERSNGRTG